jgi:glycosyltransferase involved in cell wall biosynthesis
MADMLERYLPRDKRLVVAPHGLDVGEIWEHSSDSLPESAARWVRSDIRLLHVGHPSPHKALVLLPSILAAVAERVDNCVRLALTIDPTSTDPSVNELMAKAHELGVADSIDLVGRLDQHQVFAMYGAASVLLFPSRTESFGFPVLEAFATGLPVVTSNLPAFREVGGDLVRVFEIGDTEAATDAIIESLNSDDDDRSRRRSRAAQFSVRRQAETVAGELRRLRGEKP